MKFIPTMLKEVKNLSESKPQPAKTDYYDYDEVEAQRMIAWCKRRKAARLAQEQNQTNK